MNQEEAEKKQRELAECGPIAEAINFQVGTDYSAKPTDIEPADVVFQSQSRRYPDRMVQVVSIPHDYEIRADNKNIERLKATLRECLEERGVTHCFVGLIVLNNTTKRGVPRGQVERLADEIRNVAPTTEQQTVTIDSMKMLEIDPELTAYLSSAVLFREANEARPTVDIPGVAAAVPDDGSWIEQGINLKLQKYGNAEAVKDLTLVIAVEALVDKPQVDAFTAMHPPQSLPFAEIWINSMDGVFCLKQRA